MIHSRRFPPYSKPYISYAARLNINEAIPPPLSSVNISIYPSNKPTNCPHRNHHQPRVSEAAAALIHAAYTKLQLTQQ